MSEKRIKATLHIEKCMVGRIVRVKSEDELPPDGTPVEIVYREPEIEIRPGQKWKTISGKEVTVIRDNGGLNASRCCVECNSGVVH